ncbi:MAG: hypothetical protein JXM70_00555 [Pirellulales bacterium]|nr:hypothetical protein [Pirellulales bacterium]
MWRALFLAIGISLCILGVECLAVSKFTFKARGKPEKVVQKTLQAPPQGVAPHRVIVVGDHAPWSLMGLGAVVIIYAYDLPKRMKG